MLNQRIQNHLEYLIPTKATDYSLWRATSRLNKIQEKIPYQIMSKPELEWINKKQNYLPNIWHMFFTISPYNHVRWGEFYHCYTWTKDVSTVTRLILPRTQCLHNKQVLCDQTKWKSNWSTSNTIWSTLWKCARTSSTSTVYARLAWNAAHVVIFTDDTVIVATS